MPLIAKPLNPHSANPQPGSVDEDLAKPFKVLPLVSDQQKEQQQNPPALEERTKPDSIG